MAGGLKSVKRAIRKWLNTHPHRDPKFILEPGVLNLLTSPLRRLPEYLIIGGQKCGTTSLHNYLRRHPDVASAVKKEPLFFDTMYSLGPLWYRAFFPLAYEKPRRMVGEASVHSMIHPRAPARAYRLVPDAKILVVLRNPVDRAYSHYQMSVRNLHETLPFEDAIEEEGARIGREIRKIERSRTHWSYSFVHHTYLLRGIYADHLMRWMSFYPREQFMILGSDELAEDTLNTMNRVYEFLGLKPLQQFATKKSNVRSYPAINPDCRKKLVSYFEPHNNRLNELLGSGFDWDR